MRGLKRSSTLTTPGGAKRPPKKKYRATVSIPRSVSTGKNIIARKQKCFLRYADSVRLAGSIASKGTAITLYSANGMYDPQVALGGHQPRGFDQLAALYDEYQVRRATVEVTFSADVGEQEWLPFISIRPGNSETPDLTNILEGPDRVVSKMTISNTDSGSSTYLKLSVDPVKWLGNTTYDNEASRSATNTNPIDLCTFYIGCMNVTPTLATIGVDASICITYEAEFMNPKTPGES